MDGTNASPKALCGPRRRGRRRPVREGGWSQDTQRFGHRVRARCSEVANSTRVCERVLALAQSGGCVQFGAFGTRPASRSSARAPRIALEPADVSMTRHARAAPTHTACVGAATHYERRCGQGEFSQGAPGHGGRHSAPASASWPSRRACVVWTRLCAVPS